MGKVIAKLKVTNEADLLLQRHGALNRKPRTAEVDAVVDLRVISFRLQHRIAEALGIGVSRPARLELMGRSCLANVTIVGDNQPNILDRLALMEMDFVIDPKKRRLIPNPEHGGQQMSEEY